MQHTLSKDISTMSNGDQILRLDVTHPDIALTIHAINLNAAINVDLKWSNDGVNSVPLVNADGDPQSIALTSGATSVAGAIFAFVKAKYLHLMLNKLTATAGSIVKVETNY